MGRKGENSWLTAVKRVFWPPFKNSEKRPELDDEESKRVFWPPFKNTEKRPELDDEESKKKEKRRWVFRTSQSQEQLQIQPPPPPLPSPSPMLVLEDQIYTAVAATEPLAHFPPEYYAAIIIQTVFRGFLARRALRALKGLVKLQALVRGRNVRKQADMTLKCLQSLVRVQARFREQRIRLSHSLDVATPCIKSSSIAQRRYMAMVNGRNEVAVEGEEANSYSSPYQIWRSDCYLSHMEEEEGQRRRLDQWMASRTSFSNRNRGRASMDRRDPIKTVEIDTPRPFLSTTPRRQLRYTYHNLPSPLRRSPATPSPSKAKPLQERCSSSLAAAHSTSLMAIPNYMVATESVLARLRPVNVPLQRAVSPEKERAVPAKKRLSFPAPETRSRNSVSSPSYKTAMGRLVSEQRSNLSSSCAESLGSEISPASTEDLRRWLR